MSKELMEEAQKAANKKCHRCGGTLTMLGDCPYCVAHGVSRESPDLVNHPPHYKSGGMEVIDVIHAFSLDFWLGNAAKYILRAGRKAGETRLRDLKKARWYLDDMIRRLEQTEPEK